MQWLLLTTFKYIFILNFSFIFYEEFSILKEQEPRCLTSYTGCVACSDRTRLVLMLMMNYAAVLISDAAFLARFTCCRIEASHLTRKRICLL
jgi:hypothetical protein